MSTEDAAKIVKAMESMPDWPFLTAPPGYPDSLALCIIDSIWSIGVRYGQVRKAIDHYRDWLSSESRGVTSQRTSGALVDDIGAAGGPDGFATRAVRNLTRTSSRGGILKAEAALRAATSLAKLKVLTTDDLRTRHGEVAVKGAWLSVPGQRSGVSWHYLLMNACVEDVKADRMVCAWLQRALELDSPLPPSETRRILLSAEAEISSAAIQRQVEVLEAHDSSAKSSAELMQAPVTLRAIDHAIWRWERGFRTSTKR